MTPRQTDQNLDALVARFHEKQIQMESIAFKERYDWNFMAHYFSSFSQTLRVKARKFYCCPRYIILICHYNWSMHEDSVLADSNEISSLSTIKADFL